MTSRSQVTHGVQILRHLLFKKYANITPKQPDNDAISVNRNVECFSKKSKSGHADRTHSIGHVVILYILFFFTLAL